MSEKIIYKEHPSWLNYLGLLIFAGVVFLLPYGSAGAGGGMIISVIFLVIAAISRYRSLFTITDHRIMMRTGLIANNTNEMELRHIRGINVRQNVWERLLGVGTIEIISAADGGAEVIFHGISNPVFIKEKIRSIKGTP